MNLHQADNVMRKLDGIWTLKGDHSKEARNEWLDFLLGYDYDVIREAVDDLKDRLKWRPSMAEIRDAYRAVTEALEAEVLLLEGDVDPDAPTLADVYGHIRSDWVFCWKCDMAVSLDERSGISNKPAVYHERLGLRHRVCPKSGSAPLIPTYLRNEREEYWTKKHIKRPA